MAHANTWTFGSAQWDDNSSWMDSNTTIDDFAVVPWLAVARPPIGTDPVPPSAAHPIEVDGIESPIQTDFVVTNATAGDTTDLSQVLRLIDISGADSQINTSYTITLGADITLTADPTAINLASGASLTIEAGAGHTLDGGGLHRGLFVFQGDVTIEHLVIQNARAIGGAGGSGALGGGGGAGLGGGLFVAGPNTANGTLVTSGGTATLIDTSFRDDGVVGGAGGGSSYSSGAFGSGGGMGGAGQSDGGGGGLGGNANGGPDAGAGIVSGAPGGGGPLGAGPAGGGGGHYNSSASYQGGGGVGGTLGEIGGYYVGAGGFGGGGGYGGRGGFGGGGGAMANSVRSGSNGGFGGGGSGGEVRSRPRRLRCWRRWFRGRTGRGWHAHCAWRRRTRGRWGHLRAARRHTSAPIGHASCRHFHRRCGRYWASSTWAAVWRSHGRDHVPAGRSARHA